jgi:ABC-type transport system involved in multi-copper enzyme maturation permease subunit
MDAILTIAHLTLHEARRRKIMLAAIVIGAAFLLVYAVGLFFIFRNLVAEQQSLIEQRAITGLLVLAGIYVANFLGVASAVLLAVDTLSGEIASGVIETLAAKPVRRSDIVLGKWLGYATIAAVYLVAMTVGVMIIARLITGAGYPFDAHHEDGYGGRRDHGRRRAGGCAARSQRRGSRRDRFDRQHEWQ